MSVFETTGAKTQPKAPTLCEILSGQTVLVTGAAGFFGTALLYRLVDPSLCIRRVFALIRKERGSSRLPEDLLPHIAKLNENGDVDGEGLIVVLPGDCSLPDFGLSEKQTKWLREVDIVIHSASLTRFTMSLPNAVKSIADLAYNMCHFTLNSLSVRTHIHVSTCFTGYFLPDGSVVREELVPPTKPNVQYDDHANTYVHAKCIAEGVVNAVGRAPSSKTAWRIVRLSTLGPAMFSPTPGWGAGHVSSPVCAGIAAHVVHDDKLKFWRPEAKLDVIPVDMAVNQLLGLAAAAHYKGAREPTSKSLHIGTNVPIYHVAVGRGSPWSIPIQLLNTPEFKISQPYIPVKSMATAYREILGKVVEFDTSGTRRVLGLQLYPQTNAEEDNEKSKMVQFTDEPVDVASLEVNVDMAWEINGGLGPYLKLVRDKMEKRKDK